MFKNETYQSLKSFIQRVISFVGGLIMPFSIVAQNLVPNPSFEDTLGCFLSTHPEISCSVEWSESTINNPNLNTPDLCFNGAVFFPPSSIPAFDGTKYIGVDCQPNNSEFVQAELLQTMQAGKSYCVSFYASVCDQTLNPAISLGVMFSVNEMTLNPFTNGMSAHVQGPVLFDPTVWTKITGTYTATGGEKFITLGGFQNSGQPAFVYMYIDMVEVYELPSEQIFNLEVCNGESLLLSASAPDNYRDATSFSWSTGETSSSITISQAGIYTVEKHFGECLIIDSFFVSSGNCDVDTTIIPSDTIEEQTLFIPSAFTPNGDGINDEFKIYGEGLTEIQMNIFNRWGEIIFTSDQTHFNWNGTNKGVPVQVDVYVYQIFFKNQEGIREERMGKLVLVR
jgi:gliding motility-associated-like protein